MGDESSATKLVLIPCTKAQETAVAELIDSDFPDTPGVSETLSIWRWQFRHPFTDGSWVCLAMDGDRVAAHYAVMKVPMLVGGKGATGAISSATVTGRDYRGRGLFTKTARRVYEWAADENCAVVFGFPNSQSMPGLFRKLDWFEIEVLPTYLKILRSGPFAKRFVHSELLASVLGAVCDGCSRPFQWAARPRVAEDSGLDTEISEGIPDDLDSLWPDTFLAQRVGVVRSAAYFKWRYCDKPGSNYTFLLLTDLNGRIQGLAVLSVKESFGVRLLYVMDFVVRGDSRQGSAVLLNAIEKFAKERKLVGISALLVSGHPHRLLFRRFGFIKIPKSLFPQEIYFGARVTDQDINGGYLQDPSKWYISWGDEDVV